MSEQPDKFEVLKLGNQLCFPLYACAKEIIKTSRKPLAALDLTYTQYIVMMALWEFGDMSEKELGQKIYLDSGTLTPVLKKLEKAGFIKRRRAKEDERFIRIALTEKGVGLKEKAVQIPQILDGCIHLSYDEMITLRALLQKELQGIENKRK